MIQLFTDFGLAGPYVGQMHAVLAQDAPDVPVIDLMHDAPRFKPGAAGYLLAALAPYMPERGICVAVVDPGVGTDRRPLAVQAGERWFVGPDNGLFAVLPNVLSGMQWFQINWRPQQLSASFHGRDLFAPVGAALARGKALGMLAAIDAIPAAEPELAEIIYIDGFGNAMTGLRASTLAKDAVLHAGAHDFPRATTFGDHPPGTSFWYENACGLAELSITQGGAADSFRLAVGDAIVIQDL